MILWDKIPRWRSGTDEEIKSFIYLFICLCNLTRATAPPGACTQINTQNSFHEASLIILFSLEICLYSCDNTDERRCSAKWKHKWINWWRCLCVLEFPAKQIHQCYLVVVVILRSIRSPLNVFTESHIPTPLSITRSHPEFPVRPKRPAENPNEICDISVSSVNNPSPLLTNRQFKY